MDSNFFDTVDRVILGSIRADSLGNVFYVAMDYGDGQTCGAYHYDTRTELLNVIVVGKNYSDCIDATAKYREGVRY